MVVDRFSISVTKVVLDDILSALSRSLPEYNVEPAVSRGGAQANLQVRLRMFILYYNANQLGYMVVGSGNKSELSTGYFTRYGGGEVDILPLGNLVKKQVGKLVDFLGVLQEIIDKPPSAGLWDG
jgi:NAD+ synthase